MKAIECIKTKVRFCIAAVICCAAVIGCDKPMTNDEIIVETLKCRSADMKARQVINIFDYKVRAVICEEK